MGIDMKKPIEGRNQVHESQVSTVKYMIWTNQLYHHSHNAQRHQQLFPVQYLQLPSFPRQVCGEISQILLIVRSTL